VGVTQVAFVDAEAVMRDWVKTQTALIGTGNPLAGGAWLTPPRSTNTAHAVLSRVGGGEDVGGLPLDEARISASIWGPTKEAAAKAAVAYANALRSLDGHKVTIGGVQITAADGITGPLYTPDNGLPRYLVDATIQFNPSP
jgi:hypothetical protein